MFDVDELQEPGEFGVRAAVPETDLARRALKQSLLQFPYKVSLCSGSFFFRSVLASLYLQTSDRTNLTIIITPRLMQKAHS